ncbi:phage portal protein [Weissella paramesenteroides]|uniref:Phage portal protein n=1 Tax=Weissella paramesenteroides TaxID=1249 RepID=A0ABD4XGS6_WEIPA|nr:phage portal protein [Weissella paramesenteroides]MDF8368302.1 phage portal protein [Weissella paramesenteroides]MDF8370509.1 phage portal protein [Weissella paramesenteroides]
MKQIFSDNQKANLIYQDELENLTPKRIMQFVKHHNQYQRPRLEKLDEYYKGLNVGILEQDTRRIDEGKSDHRAVHSFGKYIADFQTSFSIGNAITVKHDDDTRLDMIEDTNSFDDINSDLFLDMTRFGRAYEYIYRGEDDIEHSVALSPLETFVIYSLDVEPQPIMAVRYHLIDTIDDAVISNEYRIETWTESEYVSYQPTTINGYLVPSETFELYAFPMIEYKNNKFRIGDFENVIPLIDLYDAAQSDTANYMTDLNDAMLVIKGDIDTLLQGSNMMNGIDPTDEDAAVKLAKDKMEILKSMKSANMLLLKSGVSMTGQQTNVDADYIHKEYDVTGTESYKNRLAHDIHKFSHTPDLTDENFAGNASGVAMKYKVLGTIELASTKRKAFETGLRQRYAIIKQLEDLSASGMKVEPNEIRFTFTDNMPVDDVATIGQIVNAGATLPQEYLYQFLPNVTDPSEIVDMLATQQASQVEQARYSYGVQLDAEKGDEDDGE